MNIEDLRHHCIQKAQVTESFPFDETTLVFKVAGKMFALVGLNKADRVNLKCDPEKAIDLREQFGAIKPGYHMSKKHWNTVYFNEDVDDALIKELVDHSYDLVVSKLTKKLRTELFGK